MLDMFDKLLLNKTPNQDLVLFKNPITHHLSLILMLILEKIAKPPKCIKK